MAQIEKSIDVKVPVRTAYNQWTQFEEFPQFMEGVESIKQMGDKHLHWKAKIGGSTEEWDAEISEQIPDTRVAWHSISGAENAGAVNFHYLNPEETRVTLSMDYETSGVKEMVGDKLGFASRKIEGDLERFKTFIESRGSETGAWRGEIERTTS